MPKVANIILNYCREQDGAKECDNFQLYQRMNAPIASIVAFCPRIRRILYIWTGSEIHSAETDVVSIPATCDLPDSE